EQETLVWPDAAAQRVLESPPLRLHLTASIPSQDRRIGLTGNEILEHGAAGLAQDVGGHVTDFDIRPLQRLLDAIRNCGPPADKAGAIASQLAQCPLRAIWDEAALDQAVP